MRALFLFLALLPLLGACESLVRVGSDGFEVGSTTVERFELDAQACQIEADNALSYDLRYMGGTSYRRNRAFNGIYGRCMTARGHQPRPYIKNLLPDLDS